MSVVGQAAVLVVFPVVAAGAGAFAGALRRPSPKFTSGVQHLAAGVVFAAVATEVLPELKAQGHLWATAVGFSAGVAVLLMLAAYTRRLEATTAAPETTGDSPAQSTAAAPTARLPVGLLVAVGIDLLLDGLLVGLGVTLGSNQGLILTVALTLEILFLGLAVCAELLELGIARFRAASVAASLALATALGAIGGAAVLGDASPTVLAAVLAFGAAALLYLVVEELIVEAHEQPDTPVLSALFFLGFIALFLLAEVGG
ncbi:ZIP family metal transporter [Nakamurella endophytica]